MTLGFSRSVILAFAIARRELRAGFSGFRIFLACLTLGVAAIASIGSISTAIKTGLEADAKKILGGDLDLRLNYSPISKAQRDWLNTKGQTSEIRQMRSMARAAETNSLVEIKAVDDAYPLYGSVQLNHSTSLKAALADRGEMRSAVVEPHLLAKLNVKIGDSVRIGDIAVQISDTIKKEPDRAAQAFTLGPRVLVNAETLAATGLLKPGSLVRYHYRLRLDGSENVKAVKASLNNAFPRAGWRIRDTRNATPGIRRFVDRVGVFMTLVGLTALLVGGVGISNAVRNFLASRTPTIATMKCIGGTGPIIFLAYALQISAIATVGVLLGLLLGAVSPLAALTILEGRLPVQAVFGLYAGPLLLAAGFGYLVTIVFSLGPLAAAQTVPAAQLFRDVIAPVRRRTQWLVAFVMAGASSLLAALAIFSADDRRLAIYFVMGAVATLVAFRVTALLIVFVAQKLPRPSSNRLRLALANLHRPGAPTANVVLSLGLGLTVLVAVALIEGNLSKLVTDSLPEDAPAYYFIDIQPGQSAEFDRIANQFASVRNVTRVPMLRGRIVELAGVPVDQIKPPPEYAWILRGDRGLTWTREAPSQGSSIVAGQWWPADYNGPPLLSFDAAAAAGLGLKIGDSIRLNVLGREFDAKIANLRRIDWTTLGVNFVMILSPGVLDGAPQAHVATAQVDSSEEVPLERAITKALPNVSSIRVRDILQTVQDIVANLGIAVRVVSMVAIFAGTLVLAGAVAANHRRRVYDSVVLKVLGATRSDIVTMLIFEFGLMGLITALVAAATGTLTAWAVITQIMNATWFFQADVVIMTVAVCTAFTIAIGLAGTWSALGRKAAPLLRNN